MRVVISQSMYFPWVGLLEQIRQADVFIHYDDVQFARGFFNRVQVKQADGTSAWMSIPLSAQKRGQLIDEVETRPGSEWTEKHLSMLSYSFAGAPFRADALALARTVLDAAGDRLANVTRPGIRALAEYFGLDSGTRFLNSRDMRIGGSSSRRLLDLVKAAGGDVYLTGHGARHYLDHDLFEREGVRVEYMDYQKRPYPQGHGPFTPYVTGLDLVANCGREGVQYIASTGRNWKDFLNES